MSTPVQCFFLEDTGRDIVVEFNDGGTSTRSVFRRADTGEEMTLGNAPVGAMWFADWMLDSVPGHIERSPREAGDNRSIGPDGHCLVVRLPGGHDWMVDSRCSNCGNPGDNTHKCWVRHGTPPNITVDKAGVTCQAGAGSIQVPGWHGFLRGGMLVE